MNNNKNFLGNVSNNLKEFRNRLFFLFYSIIILRLGNFITIPGLFNYNIKNLLNNYNINFIDFLKLFSSNKFIYFSIFILGVTPYISSSIIIQLLILIFPYFKNLSKENINGKLIINKYIKYLTFFLSIFQSILFSSMFLKINYINNILINKFLFFIISVTSLVTSTMFLMWLGEQITDKGLGNGISIIIFIGIISNLPNFFFNIFKLYKLNYTFFLKLLFLFIILFFFIFFIVLVEIAQRKILIQYAIKGYQNNRYSFFLNPNDTYLPFKINIAGVIPSIFASSIMFFPSMLFIWLKDNFNFYYLNYFTNLFFIKYFIYLFIYLFLITFFCFFYTLLIFNPFDISENLKKTGAYIPNVRPGLFTTNFIKKIVFRLTLFNSIYMCMVCIMPDFISEIIKINFNLSGTSLLIIVVIIIDLINQIQTLFLSNKYLSILNKINF